MKRCTKCGEEHPLERFSRRKNSSDGRTSWCKGCEAGKARALRKKNPEGVRGYQRRWRDANREKVNRYARDYRKRHPERVRATNQKMIAKDPEAWRERSRAHSRDNPKMRRERHRRYKTRKMDAYIAPVREDEILLRDLGVCGICQERIMSDFHIDHVIPLARGGTHEPDNVQLAHPLCNQRKLTRLPSEF